MIRRSGDAGCSLGRLTLAPICIALAALLPASPSAAAPSGGRAYEQVTPSDKNGGDVGGPAIEGVFAAAAGQAAADGDSIGYVSLSSFADAVSAEVVTNYISKRSNQGWSTHAISPPAAVPIRLLALSPFQFFTPDLSASVLEWTSPALAPSAPTGFAGLYVRGDDDSYRAVTTTVPPTASSSDYSVRFAAATADLKHIVFEANDALTPEAPTGAWSVYEWTESNLRLVSVLPDETPAFGAGAGDGWARNFTDVISSDASRIFWTSAGQLYVREDGNKTTKLNASRRAISVGDGNATLLEIARDGSKALFTDVTPLTDAADDNGGLYEYDLNSGSLRNLTPSPGGNPEVRGVVGVAEDGAPVYFVAQAALATGASSGAPNLYVSRAGTPEFIGTLAAVDERAWSPDLESHTARVTPDGEHLLFLSTVSLTGFDNTDAVTGKPDPELFLFDAGARDLTCVSCNPGGNPPIGGASVPPATSRSYVPRIVTDDGSQVLFNSGDALVSRDSNRRQDVYEYADGSLHLISAGTSSDLSALVDVSRDARDVFFTTRASLVPTDLDSASDIYDARVGGGFPIVAEPLACEGEACRGPFSEQISVAPAPATAWPRDRAERSPLGHRRCRKVRRSRAGRLPHRGAPRRHCVRRGRR